MSGEHLISLQPGTVIASRYEVVKCLGTGSMGMVYACRNRDLAGHLVAVKVLFPEVAQDKIAAARFRNEIVASYGVSHPNVVRAYEFIRDGELVAYTMEYVGGGDLAERLNDPNERIPIPEVVRILAQMCSGVQAIHDAGIVHRDLKPENILLTRDGVIKIADFGIARTERGPKLTEHNGVVGTLDYVSPEYMMNSQVDWRSDIYAMGVLGYEMIAGEAPFHGDSPYDTMTQRLKNDPPAPSTLRADCPPELDNVILRAMQRDPERRYQSASEMFHDLQILLPEPVTGSGASLTGFAHPRKNSAAPKSPPPAAHTAAPRPAPSVTETIIADADQLDEVLGMHSPGREQQARPAAGVSNPPRRIKGPPPASKEPARWKEPKPTVAVPSAAYGAPREAEAPVEESYGGFQMEKLLGGGGFKSVPSRFKTAPQKSTGGFMDRGGVNVQRMRELSELAQGGSRSAWLDVFTGIVALMIGIGLGFALLKVCAPQFLAQGSTYDLSSVWHTVLTYIKDLYAQLRI